jgi:hypothetical protein
MKENFRKICINLGIFLATVGYLEFFITTFSNELVWYRYRNVLRATLLFIVINGNEVTGTIFLFLCNGSKVTDKMCLCLCNGNDVTEKICFASVTLERYVALQYT